MADDFDPDAFLAQIEPTQARLMSYGPIEGEYHNAAMYGPQGNALEPYDVAASPDMGLDQGEWIRVNGALHRVGDASYFSPGNPTSQTIELRDQRDQGSGAVARAEPFDPDAFLNRIKPFDPDEFLKTIVAPSPTPATDAAQNFSPLPRGPDTGIAPAPTPAATPAPTIPPSLNPLRPEAPATPTPPPIASAPAPEQPREEIRAPTLADQPALLLSKIGRTVDAALAPGQESSPLVSSEVAGEGVRLAGGGARLVSKLLEDVTGAPYVAAEKGVEETLAKSVSDFTQPEGIASLLSFAVPGVAESYAVGVLSKLPEQYGRLKETIQNHGLISKETAQVATEAGIQDLFGFLAAKAAPHVKLRSGEVMRNASQIEGAGGVPEPEVRPLVGKEAPLWTKDQGVAPARQAEGEVRPQEVTQHLAKEGADMGLLPAGEGVGGSMFNDPVTKSSIFVPETGTAADLAKKLADTRAKFGAEPVVEGSQEIKKLLDDYDSGESYVTTIYDVVNEAEVLAAQSNNPKLQEAVDYFREEEAYDRELGGRSDMDQTEAEFISKLEDASKVSKPTEQLATETPSESGIAAPAVEPAVPKAEPTGAEDWTSATSELGIVPKSMRGFIGKKSPLDIAGEANDLNVATAEHSAKLQVSTSEAELAQKDIHKVAPNKRTREAMSIYREAGGDQAVLKEQIANAKSKWFKQAATDALSLKPEQVAMVDKVAKTFDILEQRGNTVDVLRSHRDNYVPHVWDVTKRFSGIGGSRLKSNFKFAKARTFENFFAGDQAGFKPKTLDIGELLPAYLHEMNTVIADRQFIRDLSSGRSTEGEPLVIPRGNAKTVEAGEGGTQAVVNPRGFASATDAQGNPIDQFAYKIMEDQPALANWRWVETDPQGNTTLLKSDLAVHPEAYKRLNAMMGQSAIRKWYNEPSTGLSTIPRAIAKGLDTSQSTMKREMFGLLAPFHQVQEGVHGVGHLANPLFALEDMSRPTPQHIDSMRHGLMLKPEKLGNIAYGEGLGSRNTFISQVARKYGMRAGREIANVIDGYQTYLFEQYIPALKFKTYEHMVERNMGRYKPELARGEVTEADVKFLSAEQSNAAFGHLNKALLDRNPTIQHLLQLGLLAPDFLEARARFVGQALKPSKAGFEQFRAIATLAAIQAGSAILLAKLGGGEWDPKHPFEVTFGTRTYFLRSVPEDMFRLLFSGTNARREFVSARMNPFAQKTYQTISGRNYRGEQIGFWDTVGELLANYIPITARSAPGVRELTKTSRQSPTSPLEQLAGSLGLKIARHSPIAKTYELATAWKDEVGLPKDVGSYPISKYQQLRYALEDSDTDKAKDEIKKLIDSGMKPEKVHSGFKESLFHPFTGSKASDKKFSESLKEGDKETYNLAVQRRKDIYNRFLAIPR